MFLTFPAFPSGELSPQLEGRSDLPALRMGLAKGRNVIPHKLGGLLQRPGLIYRGLAFDQTQDAVARVKLIPFVADAETAFVLEFSEGRIRFRRNNSLLVTSAGNVGRPGVISLFTEPLTIQTPYALADLRELQWCHANDVMWLAHRSYPVQKLTRYTTDGFYFEPMAFLFPPLRDGNVEDVTLSAVGTLTEGGTVALTAVGGDVFAADDVGAYYGIDHRRATPYAEISLSQGSGTASVALSFTGNAVAGETVTVGTGVNLRTYTWRAAVEGPYSIQVGGTTTLSAEAFADAINGTANILVGSGTIAHPSVEAEDLGGFASNIAATGFLAFTGDNDLTAGTPDQFTIGAVDYEFDDDVTTGGAFHVKRGATKALSIANSIMAINATGVAGVNYTAGTVANTDVTASTVVTGDTIKVTAITAGNAGNAIATTVDHTSRMAWGNTTLTGGADASTRKVQVAARIQGAAGNANAVAETMSNATWQPAAFLAGGADNTNFDPANPAAVIPTVRVNGTWEVYTLGRWYGLLTLQQQRATGEWEVVRTWESKNDGPNVQATGIVDGEKLMRLIYVGSGVADDDAPARAVLTATDAVVHGLVLITVVTDSTHATGTVVRDIWSTEATYLWSGGSWNDRYGFPSAVVLHQQRLVFGQGARITGSQTGGFDNFERSELADSSYQYELAATVATNIVSMQSQSALMILTEDSEWLADGGAQGSVITPMSIRAEHLTDYGAARCPSQIVGSNVVFIQTGGIVANEYLFEFANQDFTAVDLGELADHLTREVLVELAYARVPHSLIFFVTDAGSLLSLSYRRNRGNADQGGQLAWTKHTTPSGFFESVCVVPGSNEVSDVWVCVRRTLPSGAIVRTLESFDVNYWETLADAETDSAAVVDLCCLDGAVKATGIVAASPTVTGLGHLEGLTVSVLLNGCVHPDRVVNGAAISLDMSGVTEPATAIVGVAPLAEIQPFFASLQLRDGGSDGRAFRVAKLNTRFYLSGAAEYSDGNEAEGLVWYPVTFRTTVDPVDEPVKLRTELQKFDLTGGFMNQTRFRFRNQSPLPMNLLGVTAELQVSG